MNQSETTQTLSVEPNPLDALETHSGDFQGYAFIIPLDAPLPIELADYMNNTGSLYERLAPVAAASLGDEIALVPLSGAELITLDRVWARLQLNKKVAVLTALPGAKYDVLFDQARRGMGLRAIDWPSIEEAFAARVITKQRTSDKSPWKSGDVAELPSATESTLGDSERVLEEPADAYSED
jgi:hypothetical protein